MESLWVSRASPLLSIFKWALSDAAQAAPRFMPGSFQYEDTKGAEGEQAPFSRARSRLTLGWLWRSNIQARTARHGDPADPHASIRGVGRDAQRGTRGMQDINRDAGRAQAVQVACFRTYSRVAWGVSSRRGRSRFCERSHG